MKVNYEEFLKRFESSGLTQQAFGEQEGISASMVSYYVRKGKETQNVEEGFAALRVSSSEVVPRTLKIKYPSGIELELPL